MTAARAKRRCNPLLAWLVAPIAQAQTAGVPDHVPPDPPQSHVHAMAYDEMADMMGMDDRRRFGKVMLERIEWGNGSADAFSAWQASAWYGGDFDKLWLESEGQRSAERTEEARTEIAWDRIVSAWWSLRAGLRHDGGVGPARDWAALGIAGTAPGLFAIEAGFYLGEGGRTALRLAGHRDYLLTQRWVLRPEVELDAYGRDDPERRVGSGISSLDAGLRLRYEIRREFAPYVGVSWTGRFGASANYHEPAGEAGNPAHDWTWRVGVRAWF
jgi:copper resistance protein B